MTPFSALTVRGRARRLRAVAWAALAEYDLDVHRMRLITNSWNCVFRVDTPDDKYVLRVTLPGHGHSPATVRSEAAFLAALAESDLEVPTPIPARDGRLVVSAGAPGVPEARMCGVYTWIPGPELGSRISPANWFKHGALHARLHDFAEAWTPPDLSRPTAESGARREAPRSTSSKEREAFPVNDYSEVFHFPGEVVLWDDDVDLLGHRGLLREALAASNERITAIRARDPVIVTHGDLHQWNCLIHRGVLRPIDFEDLMWATRGLDVGTTLYYSSKRSDYAELRDAFRRGYESVAPWPEGRPGEIDALRFPRGLDLLNVFAGEFRDRVRDWPGTVNRIAGLARATLDATEGSTP